MKLNLRDIVAAKGWGDIAEPTAHGLGTSANTSEDELLALRLAEIDVLKAAAKIVARDASLAKLFDRFLTEAIGDE